MARTASDSSGTVYQHWPRATHVVAGWFLPRANEMHDFKSRREVTMWSFLVIPSCARGALEWRVCCGRLGRFRLETLALGFNYDTKNSDPNLLLHK